LATCNTFLTSPLQTPPPCPLPHDGGRSTPIYDGWRAGTRGRWTNKLWQAVADARAGLRQAGSLRSSPPLATNACPHTAAFNAYRAPIRWLFCAWRTYNAPLAPPPAPLLPGMEEHTGTTYRYLKHTLPSGARTTHCCYYTARTTPLHLERDARQTLPPPHSPLSHPPAPDNLRRARHCAHYRRSTTLHGISPSLAPPTLPASAA